MKPRAPPCSLQLRLFLFLYTRLSMTGIIQRHARRLGIQLSASQQQIANGMLEYEVDRIVRAVDGLVTRPKQQWVCVSQIAREEVTREPQCKK